MQLSHHLIDALLEGFGVGKTRWIDHKKELIIDATVDARPIEDIKSYLPGKEVILLGPQVRFKEKQIRAMVEDRSSNGSKRCKN